MVNYERISLLERLGFLLEPQATSPKALGMNGDNGYSTNRHVLVLCFFPAGSPRERTRSHL